MSYLLDKKIQQKKFSKIALVVVVLIILFYFRSGIWNGLSRTSEIIFHPVLVLSNNVGEKLKNVGSFFLFKSYLYNQNQKLQAEVAFDDARMANYDSVVTDEASLKEILNRKDPKAIMTMATILSKPNQSPYDTLLIDAGITEGIKVGDIVFALGDVPIGRISDIYPNSSKVILFSNPGETTQAIISLPPIVSSPNESASTDASLGGNIFVQIVGRGGGNFEMVMPKDFVLQQGGQAVLPGIDSYVLAIVQKVISDPRNPFTKVLLASPVNIQKLKFVEVQQ
jgi:cell shape-determining protein MreC